MLLLGITFGKNAKVYNSVYLDIHPESNVTIGDDFVMFSNVTKLGKDEIVAKVERTI